MSDRNIEVIKQIQATGQCCGASAAKTPEIEAVRLLKDDQPDVEHLTNERNWFKARMEQYRSSLWTIEGIINELLPRDVPPTNEQYRETIHQILKELHQY